MRNKIIHFFLFFSFGLLVFFQAASAQDSSYINALIRRIAALQVQTDGTFVKGLFPSYIAGKEKFSDKKPDNNIFYNGLIAYTLKNGSNKLDQTNRQQVTMLLQQSLPVYEKFKNRSGRNTYNFWRTDTAFHYPYIGLVNSFMKQAALPDDMDDTVLSLLALDADDPTANAVHDLMQQYVNSDSNKVKTVIKDFSNYPAYSAWFGKKFPVVFDISVMCNMLAFVQHYDMPWTKADSASLAVIVTSIKNDYHINMPVYASPYYPKTSLILYHIARLMSVKAIPELEAVKPKLVKDAGDELSATDNLVEKIVLSSALIRWGENPPALQLPPVNALLQELEQNNFSFFAGNIPSYFANWLRKYTSTNGWLIYYHYCPAFNDALLLEYLLLKKQQ